MPVCTATTRQAPQHAGAALVQARASHPEPVASTELFKGAQSVLIEHNGALYRLQSTKLGKLILTK